MSLPLPPDISPPADRQRREREILHLSMPLFSASACVLAAWSQLIHRVRERESVCVCFSLYPSLTLCRPVSAFASLTLHTDRPIRETDNYIMSIWACLRLPLSLPLPLDVSPQREKERERSFFEKVTMAFRLSKIIDRHTDIQEKHTLRLCPSVLVLVCLCLCHSPLIQAKIQAGITYLWGPKAGSHTVCVFSGFVILEQVHQQFCFTMDL